MESKSMTKQEFLEKIAQLCNEYEGEENNQIVGCEVRIPSENKEGSSLWDEYFFWSGGKMEKVEEAEGL